MQHRNITGTDLEVSALCLGGGAFCDLSAQEEAFRIFDAFFEAGGNFIDTANVYGRWFPHGQNTSEQLIGAWMRSRGCRDRMVVTTKGAHPPLDAMTTGRLSREEIAADLDSSLRALGVDCIDLYYLHRDDTDRPAEEIVDTMNSFVKQGKLRFFGVSNWTAARIGEANAYAAEAGLCGISASQPMWSLASINAGRLADQTLVPMDDEMYFMHLQTGLTAVPYSSQAQGYFSKLAQDPAAADRMPVYDNEINLLKLARVKELSNAYGASINQIALAYLLCQPFATVPIVGCNTVEKLADSLGATELALGPDELLYLGLSAE